MNDTTMIIILQIAGIIAILAELIIPSAGLLTAAAVGFFGWSYYLIYQHSPNIIIYFIAANLIIISAILVWGVNRLKKSKASLSDTIDGEAFVSPVEIGATGIAITDLRPAGTAKINDKNIDVYSEGEYIGKGTKIKVISAENAGVKVAVL